MLLSNQAFNVTSLTQAINILPNRYGRLEQLGLMPPRPVRTRQIAVEENNGVLALLPTTKVGAPGTVGNRGKRTVRSFVIPHIPHDDILQIEEVQNVRAFGSDNELSAVSDVVAQHLQSMRDKHAITLEHLRMGALRGIIYDADGSTLYNLFTEFGISQTSVNFVLGTTTTDVRAKCITVARAIEDALMGEVFNGIRVLCSEEFFDALTGHTTVKATFANWQEAQNRIGGDMRSGFTYGGLTFEEYRGKSINSSTGAALRFIAANEGHAFPVGTSSTFATYFAPADFIETANTLGQPVYAKQEPRQFGRGYDLHTQSNPLPMCHRPGVLVKCTVS